MGYQKGHWGEYTGNAKWSKDHAHTKVTKENYKASERDDAAHIDYLKRDILYDDHHGHSDEKMTADEKHISKLAGDMKYDKKHHGSPAKNKVYGKSHSQLKEEGPRVIKAHLKLEHKDYETLDENKSKRVKNLKAEDLDRDKDSPATKKFVPQDINKNGEIEGWEIGKAKAMNKNT